MKDTRYFLLLAAVTLLTVTGTAQNKELKKANQLYDAFEYKAASALLEKCLQKYPGNKPAAERLAECYVKLNDTGRSEYWLSVVCTDSNVQPKYLKFYADVLASNGKYSESKNYYQKYSEKIRDPHVLSIIGGLNVNMFYEDSSYYLINKLEFNSGAADFSPTFYKDGLVFCSSRETGKKQPKYAWDESAFIDLYYASLKTGIVEPLAGSINSTMHEGPASFSLNGDTVYFTRNNFTARKTSSSNDGIVKLKLYAAAKSSDGWRKEVEMPFNSHEYSTGHPSTSFDGRLYFVSDMPGGFGGTDIYYVENNKGAWTSPVNLGSSVNTPGNEMFPFVDKKGELYFASNGHPGLGGLDVFKSTRSGLTFNSPANLGYPVNSSKDDFGFIIDGEDGFFSSNRGRNHLDDNLYSFHIEKTKSLTLVAVSGDKHLSNFALKIAKDGIPLSDDEIVLFHSGNFHADHTYEVVVSKFGYKDNRIIIDKKVLKGLVNHDTLKVELENLPKRVFVTLATIDGKRITLGNIEVKNLQTRSEVVFVSGTDGVVKMDLDQAVDYQLTGTKVNFKKSTIHLTSAQIQKLSENERVVITLHSPSTLFEKNELGQIIEMDIKYDLGKFNIRKDAAKELDRLVDYLKKNPNIKVELGSHTDSRGSAEANETLSQKRAASAAKYLVGKGIRTERIIPAGYGEEDLKVIDATSEEQHQQNRRTTVKIVGI